MHVDWYLQSNSYFKEGQIIFTKLLCLIISWLFIPCPLYLFIDWLSWKDMVASIAVLSVNEIYIWKVSDVNCISSTLARNSSCNCCNSSESGDASLQRVHLSLPSQVSQREPAGFWRLELPSQLDPDFQSWCSLIKLEAYHLLLSNASNLFWAETNTLCRAAGQSLHTQELSWVD